MKTRILLAFGISVVCLLIVLLFSDGVQSLLKGFALNPTGAKVAGDVRWSDVGLARRLLKTNGVPNRSCTGIFRGQERDEEKLRIYTIGHFYEFKRGINDVWEYTGDGDYFR